MLSRATQIKLLQLLQLPDADITTMIDSEEEQDAAIPDGLRVYDADAYAQLEAQLKKEAKTAHINAGKEIAIKDLKEKAGLDHDGKDPELFLQKLIEKATADANTTAATTLKAEQDKAATLQQSLDEYKQKLQATEQEKAAIALDAQLLRTMPANRNTSLTDDDRLLLIKNKLQITEADGAPVYRYKGEALPIDPQHDNPLQEALQHVFTAEQWLTDSYTKQGRGGHSHRNSNNTRPMKLSEAETAWEKEGRPTHGADFQAHITALKKENADFDLNG